MDKGDNLWFERRRFYILHDKADNFWFESGRFQSLYGQERQLMIWKRKVLNFVWTREEIYDLKEEDFKFYMDKGDDLWLKENKFKFCMARETTCRCKVILIFMNHTSLWKQCCTWFSFFRVFLLREFSETNFKANFSGCTTMRHVFTNFFPKFTQHWTSKNANQSLITRFSCSLRAFDSTLHIIYTINSFPRSKVNCLEYSALSPLEYPSNIFPAKPKWKLMHPILALMHLHFMESFSQNKPFERQRD